MFYDCRRHEDKNLRNDQHKRITRLLGQSNLRTGRVVTHRCGLVRCGAVRAVRSKRKTTRATSLIAQIGYINTKLGTYTYYMAGPPRMH